MAQRIMSRRKFLRVTFQGMAGMAFTASVITSGCEYGSSSGGGGSDECSIAGNHGHGCLDVDFQSTNPITVTLNGGHQHTVDLSAQDLADIRAGQTVTRGSSSTNDHSHNVTFQMA